MRLDVLIDADAFLFVRKLSILETMRATSAVKLRLTQYVARRELNAVDGLVRELEREGRLEVHAVVRRSPADELYRQLVGAGIDKGEAEAIAWAAHHGHDDLVIVSSDAGARKAAAGHHLAVGDIMDLVVMLVEWAGVDEDVLRGRLWPWADKEQQIGRPKDLTPFDFDEAMAKRRPRWPARPPSPLSSQRPDPDGAS